MKKTDQHDHSEEFEKMIEYFNKFRLCGVIIKTNAQKTEHRLFTYIEKNGYSVLPLGNNKFKVEKK